MLQTRICRFIASVIEERYYVIQEEISHGGLTIASVEEMPLRDSRWNSSWWCKHCICSGGRKCHYQNL